jgi:hypothetical protein
MILCIFRRSKVMSDDAPIKGKFKGGDPVAVGKLGGRPKGSKNKEKHDLMQPLPEKKRKYVLNLTKGMSKREAALQAGYNISMADHAKSRIETADVKAAFQQLLLRKIPLAKAVRRMREGMDAVETKFFAKDGVVTDHRDVINHTERRKYTALYAQMSGAWTPKQEITSTQTIDPDTARRLMDISEKLGLAHIPPEQLKKLEGSHVPLVIDAEIADIG